MRRPSCVEVCRARSRERGRFNQRLQRHLGLAKAGIRVVIHSCAEAAAHQRANLLALLALACRWREARTLVRLAHLLQQESVSCKDGAYGE
eukprot:scaffold3164_cov56-Phaeocystis_antarctica.AAC.1